MRSLRFLLLLSLVALPAAFAHSQVSVGIGIGGPVYAPAYGGYEGYDYGPPVCDWGYYPYAPYGCAPYGYYGPSWFVSGLFIGAGPWYGWRGGSYGGGYYRSGYYGHDGYYGRGGYGRDGYGRGGREGYGRDGHDRDGREGYGRDGRGSGAAQSNPGGRMGYSQGANNSHNGYAPNSGYGGRAPFVSSHGPASPGYGQAYNGGRPGNFGGGANYGGSHGSPSGGYSGGGGHPSGGGFSGGGGHAGGGFSGGGGHSGGGGGHSGGGHR